MKIMPEYRLPTVVATGLLTLLLVPAVTVGQSRQISRQVPAAEESSFHYIFFWKQDDSHTRSMLQVFHEATQNLPVASATTIVRLDDSRQRSLVDQYDVSRAPMPLVLAVAPNGAVTKAWPVQFTAEQLGEGIVSPHTANCLKALQDKKLVVLCVMNRRTPNSQASYQSALAFQADPRFADATRVFVLDADDSRETSFLRQLQIAPGTNEPITLVLAPPGEQIAKLTGHVTNEQLVAKVTAAQQACCPGGQCGPNGQCDPGQCCPGGKCGPQQNQ
ncbi:MAG: hypothetical protein WEA31_11140 [Pirellulales bacterium]